MVLLSVLFLLYFFPFAFVVINSFKSTKEFLTSPLAFPLKLEISNYIMIVSQKVENRLFDARIILDMLWIWNDFLLPNLVLIKPENRTLPLSTFYFFGTYTVDYGLLMASLMMTMIPIIVVYLFLQKHIIKGVMQGSIK